MTRPLWRLWARWVPPIRHEQWDTNICRTSQLKVSVLQSSFFLNPRNEILEVYNDLAWSIFYFISLGSGTLFPKSHTDERAQPLVLLTTSCPCLRFDDRCTNRIRLQVSRIRVDSNSIDDVHSSSEESVLTAPGCIWNSQLGMRSRELKWSCPSPSIVDWYHLTIWSRLCQAIVLYIDIL